MALLAVNGQGSQVVRICPSRPVVARVIQAPVYSRSSTTVFDQAQVIVKGLRSLEDFQGEFQQAVGNKGIDQEIETFCLFGKPDLFAISSTLVRELAFMGESIEAYVLPSVADIVTKVIQNNPKK